MRKIMHVVGARPNFMKAAPVVSALSAYPDFEQIIVHTGQHYDERMSSIFFKELGLPEPDINLAVGSGSHAVQTADIMTRFEAVVLSRRPDLIVVYGDVNSTVACALVAAKLEISVAHVEAGLRSWDRSMPEEVNRLVTDQLSDLLFTPSPDGDANLYREGVAKEKIHFVGNVMIDTLVRLLPSARRPAFKSDFSPYVLVTLHRPSNVDDPNRLKALVDALKELAEEASVIFPIHPRTRSRIDSAGLVGGPARLQFVDPQSYLEFLWLQKNAAVVITDSGGVQEETTWLGVPCLTMRKNTERPITCSEGTSILVGEDIELLKAEVRKNLVGTRRKPSVPALWDGSAGVRIAKVISSRLRDSSSLSR